MLSWLGRNPLVHTHYVRSTIRMARITSADLFRGCLNKRPYNTQEQAEAMAEYLLELKGHDLISYQCKVCYLYHLASRVNSYESVNREN